MIRQLRSAKRVRQVIWFGLLLFIIPSFVLFYGWGDFSSTLNSKGQLEPPAVVKYGLFEKSTLTHRDLQTADNELKGQYTQYARANDIAVNEEVIDKLAEPKDQVKQALNLEALRRYAKEHGLIATSDEAVDMLKTAYTPEQREQYLQYLKSRGLTLESQIENMKQGMLFGKVMETIGSKVRVTNYEAWLDYQLKNERLIADYVRLDAADYQSSVTVAEDELKAYFDKNREKFEIKDQANYSYVLVNKDLLKSTTTVTEDDITSYYNTNKETFRLPRTATVRQIFLKKPTAADVGSTSSAALTSATAEVRTLAQDLSQRAMKGEDFAALADKHNQETRTFPRENVTTDTTGLDAPTTAGGMIGEVSEGRMKTILGDTWTSTVFSLKPGAISQPIEVPRGFYVAKIEAIKEGRVQNVGEVREVVMEQVKDQKVGPKFEAVGELMRETADKNSGLQKLAEVTGTSVTETGKTDKTATFLPGVGMLGEFAEMVADLQKGGRSEVLSDSNRHLVIEIKEEFPAHIPTLDEVRDNATKAFKDMKALEMARAAAEALKAKSTDLTQLQAAAMTAETTVTKSRPFTRKDVATVLGPIPGFMRDTAGNRKGDVILSVLGTKAEPTGYIVWHLSQVTEPSKAEFARELFTITRDLEMQKRQVLLQEFYRAQQKTLLPKTEISSSYQ